MLRLIFITQKNINELKTPQEQQNFIFIFINELN